jgi:hypothetical protein
MTALMKQKGWKIIGAHSLPAAKAVHAVTTFRDVARGGLNAENSFGFQSKGEICLLTFLFIEQLTRPRGLPRARLSHSELNKTRDSVG